METTKNHSKSWRQVCCTTVRNNQLKACSSHRHNAQCELIMLFCILHHTGRLQIQGYLSATDIKMSTRICLGDVHIHNHTDVENSNINTSSSPCCQHQLAHTTNIKKSNYYYIFIKSSLSQHLGPHLGCGNIKKSLARYGHRIIFSGQNELAATACATHCGVVPVTVTNPLFRTFLFLPSKLCLSLSSNGCTACRVDYGPS